MNEIEQLKKEVKELQDTIKSLTNNTTIPFDIGEAMKARILQDAGVALTSSKTNTSENTTVVSSVGPTTFTAVLSQPDGFLQITILGNIYFIPYYS